jgi:hypothetical protein
MTPPRTFSTPLLRDPAREGGYLGHHLVIPPEVADALTAEGVRRVVGVLVGPTPGALPVSFARMMHREAEGRTTLHFGVAWIRHAVLAEGDDVAVELAPDPDPNRVDLPVELEDVLAGDWETARLWNALTPGRQRSLAYVIERMRRPESRRRKAEALMEGLRKGEELKRG